jgi:hypothetical protein
MAIAPVSAAGPPDWVLEIADSAPRIAPGFQEHSARILLNDTRLEVRPDGTYRVTIRRAVQALVPDAEQVGLGKVHLDDRIEVVKARAWHLAPGSRAKRSKATRFDLNLSDYYLDDSKTRYLGVEGVEKGSIVFFEFEMIEKPIHLVYRKIFWKEAPADLVRLEVSTPPGWTSRHAWLRRQAVEPQVTGGTTVWEVRDLPVSESEPMGDPVAFTVPILVVGLDPPPGAKVRAVTVPDWIALAEWFERLAAGRDEATPEITAKANDLLADTAGDLFETVRIAGRYVRDRVRYIAKEVGIGGYRPRAAGEVLHNLYGDCKDKGTLLRSFLATRGFDSYPILINTAMPGTVSDEVPDPGAFNHFIVGVPVPADTEVPEDFADAVVDAGDLGRLLIVDTTDEYTSIGSIPAILGGKTALVIAGKQSALVTLPDDDPAIHRVEKRCNAEIFDDMSVAIDLHTVRHGGPARVARYAYRQSAKDYRDAVESHLQDRWPESTIEEFEVVAETDAGAFDSRISLRLAPPEDPRTAELLNVFPGATDHVPRVSLSRRETAVVFDMPLSLTYAVSIRNAPSNLATPTGTEARGNGWSVTSSFDRDGDVIYGALEMNLSRLRFEPDEFRELRKFWSAVRRAAGPTVARAE